MSRKSYIRILLADNYYFLKGKLIRLFKAILYFLYNGFITNFPSYTIRTFYLRAVLNIQIGRETAIHTGCFFAGSRITIGRNTVIARNCYLDGRIGKIDIGDNVSVAPETCIISLTHDKNSPVFASVPKDVKLEDYTWIGMRAMILPGVLIGKGAIVGAGSVVTKSVEPFNIVGGNPAQVLGKRTENLQYTLSYFPLFNTDI